MKRSKKYTNSGKKQTYKKKGKWLSKEQQQEVGYLVENNFPLTEIAEYYERHHSSVWRIACKLKIERKSIHQVLEDRKRKRLI